MNGFELVNQVLYISKDPEAQLFYTLDWSQWLEDGDSISVADYTVTTRINDPEPLVKVSSGISGGNKTYIELKDGQEGKSYTVDVKVTTADGLIDRRYFKVKVENRSA